MHGHGSVRAESVSSDVFWGKAKSGRSHSQTLGSDDGCDVGCTDGVEAMIGRRIADGGGGIASLVVQAEEDIDARFDWAGCSGLRTEVVDSLNADGIIMIFEGDDNLGGLAEMFTESVPGEEAVPDEEQEVHEGTGLDCPAVASAPSVFVGTEAEVEANGDQVGDVMGSGVRGGSCRSNNGVHDYQGDGLSSFDRWIFKPVGLEFPRKALVEPGVCLRVVRFSGFGNTIHEVGCCNHPPCLRNIFFTKSAHPALGVLGVTNRVTADLEDLDARDGWILESRIDQQGGT